MVIMHRDAVLLLKIESSEGSDASPAAATDAVLVELDDPTFDTRMAETNEVSGTLDTTGPIIGGTTVNLPFSVLMRGSGTPETAPQWGKLLKAAGFAETVTSSAVPSSPEACASGASAVQATLGASASSTAQAYRGMPVVFTGDGAGTSFISNYTAAKLATLTDTMGASLTTSSNYQILKNVRYSPASSSIGSLTAYLYRRGLLYKFVGCRLDGSLELPTNQPGRLRFTLSGIYLSKTDTSIPTDDAYDSATPPVFKSATFKLNRIAQAISNFGLNIGNSLAFPDNPNATEGVDAPQITARSVGGSFDPLAQLVATQDPLGDFRAGTERILHARWGSTAGNRFGVTIPRAQVTGYGHSNKGGMLGETISFRALGEDASAFITCY